MTCQSLYFAISTESTELCACLWGPHFGFRCHCDGTADIIIIIIIIMCTKDITTDT